jgi:hypothetical protein
MMKIKERNLKKSEKWADGENFQERQSFQRYLRDSQSWQTQMFYLALVIAMLLAGIFLRLIIGGITG